MASGKTTSDSSSEERASSANYIISFYNEVSQLTGYYAQYFNLLLLHKNKYGTKEDSNKVEEIDKNTLVTSVQNIRYHTQTVYIQYTCIANKLKISDKELTIKVNFKNEEKEVNIHDLYNLVRNEFIIKVHYLECFVTLLNQILVTNVMKNLLENSQNIVENVFKDEEKK